MYIKNVINSLKELTGYFKKYKNVLPDSTDSNLDSLIYNQFLKELDRIFNNNKIIYNLKVGNTDIFPKDIEKMISDKGTGLLSIFSKAERLNMELNDGYSEEEEKRLVFIHYSLIFYYILIFQLLYPVIYLLSKNSMMKYNYSTLGFEKSDLNRLKNWRNLVFDNIDFIENGDIKDNDLRKMEMILKRILKSILGSLSDEDLYDN